MIVGDFGLGKSTVLRALHGEMSGRRDIVSTLLPTAKFPTALAFLKKICDDLWLFSRRRRANESAESMSLTNGSAKGKAIKV
jgi:hypothetical protein